MTEDTKTLIQNKRFEGISRDLQEKLKKAELVQFKSGSYLSVSQQIGSDVFLIAKGCARLIGRDNGAIITIDRLIEGDFVGLISLLRGKGCEDVIASTELLAWKLSDRLIVELMQCDCKFSQWAKQNVFKPELFQLIEAILRTHPRQGISISNELSAIKENVRVVSSSARRNSEQKEEHSRNARLYCASNNIQGFAIGDPIEGDDIIRKANALLPPRLFEVPVSWLESLSIDSSTEPTGQSATQNATDITNADQAFVSGDLPLPTAIEIDGEQRSLVRIKRASGAVPETIACLQMLAATLNLPFRSDAIENIINDSIKRSGAPSLQLVGNIAVMMGLHVSRAAVPSNLGGRLITPSIVSWKESFALVLKANDVELLMASPCDGYITIKREDLESRFPDGIEALIIERSIQSQEKRFGFEWFIPAIKKHRKVLIQVLLASFVVQLITLANPLLIQVIIDKVINQRSLDTLQLLGFALVCTTLLEGGLNALRTFIFTETTNNIDIRLGSEVIDHLLRLPLGYFDRRPVGELSTRLSELEKIREFLTGQALTTILDAIFSVIYIAVMLVYSWLLSIVALSVLPVQIGLTLLGAPLFRRQYRAAAQANAETQSHLVEVMSGIQTVKAQNIETISRWKWQDLYHSYISRSYDKVVTGTSLNVISQILQKLSDLMVLWVGASLVLDAQLTLGQLIAFRIISGYVTQPLLRLSTIWQSIQELRVSFERIADILDTNEESNKQDKGNIPLPSINGHVRYENISFAFDTASRAALTNINLEIPAGTFVGIVGQSGSGKSTLTKLLSRLYEPTSGRIYIDDFDIAKVELYSLRRQIGIVPQEPLLFSGSVADNICLTNPSATNEEMVVASRQACAHEFVMKLPNGYSTPVGERGASLSGGQRQRIALARTLLSKPRLLILDEATSALDYDTEKRVCKNLLDDLHDCTVFFVTHRLSTIQRADLILMMDAGAISESGTHDELMALRGRYYTLFCQQG